MRLLISIRTRFENFRDILASGSKNSFRPMAGTIPHLNPGWVFAASSPNVAHTPVSVGVQPGMSPWSSPGSPSLGTSTVQVHPAECGTPLQGQLGVVGHTPPSLVCMNSTRVGVVSGGTSSSAMSPMLSVRTPPSLVPRQDKRSIPQCLGNGSYLQKMGFKCEVTKLDNGKEFHYLQHANEKCYTLETLPEGTRGSSKKPPKTTFSHTWVSLAESMRSARKLGFDSSQHWAAAKLAQQGHFTHGEDLFVVCTRYEALLAEKDRMLTKLHHISQVCT